MRARMETETSVECMQRIRPSGMNNSIETKSCCAGQAVVAFARGVHDGLGYALKFFLDCSAFLAERDTYRSSTLGSLLLQVKEEYDPDEAPHAPLGSRCRHAS